MSRLWPISGTTTAIIMLYANVSSVYKLGEVKIDFMKLFSMDNFAVSAMIRLLGANKTLNLVLHIPRTDYQSLELKKIWRTLRTCCKYLAESWFDNRALMCAGSGNENSCDTRRNFALDDWLPAKSSREWGRCIMHIYWAANKCAERHRIVVVTLATAHMVRCDNPTGYGAFAITCAALLQLIVHRRCDYDELNLYCV